MIVFRSMEYRTNWLSLSPDTQYKLAIVLSDEIDEKMLEIVENVELPFDNILHIKIKGTHLSVTFIGSSIISIFFFMNIQ